MNKSLLARLVILFLTTSALSACLLVPVEDGRRGGGYHDGGRGGDRYGDRHDRPGR